MKLLFLILLVFVTFSASSQALSSAHKKAIMQFISSVKNGEVDQLAEKVSYPFRRVYPLPEIKNAAQFIKRYREVFDGELIKQISQPDLILTKGECFTEGTGGNHRYVFKNGEYVYTCSITVMGEGEQPPATLEVHKNRKQLLFQEVVKLKS